MEWEDLKAGETARLAPILTQPFWLKPGRRQGPARQVMQAAHTQPKCEAASGFPHCTDDIVKE
jgi:hypothetical protein